MSSPFSSNQATCSTTICPVGRHTAVRRRSRRAESPRGPRPAPPRRISPYNTPRPADQATFRQGDSVKDNNRLSTLSASSDADDIVLTPKNVIIELHADPQTEEDDYTIHFETEELDWQTPNTKPLSVPHRPHPHLNTRSLRRSLKKASTTQESWVSASMIISPISAYSQESPLSAEYNAAKAQNTRLRMARDLGAMTAYHATHPGQDRGRKMSGSRGDDLWALPGRFEQWETAQFHLMARMRGDVNEVWPE